MNTTVSRLPLLRLTQAGASKLPPLWWSTLGLAAVALAMMMAWYVLTLQQSVARGLTLREDWRVADAAEVARLSNTRGLAHRPPTRPAAPAAAR